MLSLTGPIVRVAPREISINDPNGPQQIYNIKGEFLKAEFYDRIKIEENIFNTRQVELHRRWRRLLSNPMSESALKVHQPVIDSKVRTMIQSMQGEMARRGATGTWAYQRV
jgi:hypothetical protein